MYRQWQSALRKQRHGRFDLCDQAGDQSGSDGASPAGERFILHATFVGSDADVVRVQHLDEVDIGARWLEEVVVPCGPANANQVNALGVFDKIDAVRHAGMEKVRFARCPVNRHTKMQPKSGRVREADLDSLGLVSRTSHNQLSVDDSSERFKPHPLRCDPLQIREPGGAAGPVSAELCLAAIRVEEPPAKIGSSRALDQDEPVAPDRHPVPADLRSQSARPSRIDDPRSVIHKDKIIPTAGQLHEGNGLLFGLWSWRSHGFTTRQE